MKNFSSKTALGAAAIAAALVVAAGGVAYAVTSGTDTSGFLVPDFQLPAASTDGAVSQSVAGLWQGNTATSFSEVSGPSWVSVSPQGVISGTAPATQQSPLATVTVAGSDGNVTDDINVEIPVTPAGQGPTVEAASWNLDDAGANASWSAEQKEVKAIVAGDLQVVGLQGTDGAAAAAIARDLGWHDYQSAGDLGLISAFPISNVTDLTSNPLTPALGASIDVGGQTVRIWTTDLDASNYGPETACFTSPAPSAATLIADEKGSTRYAQAQAVASAMGGDLATTSSTPVLLLGDLESPSAADWTSATAASHCNIGAVDWPVPDVFASAGLTDSYRLAYPDPATDPGNTWSPTEVTNSNGQPEPQDRIDYIDYAGNLTVVGAESYASGWVSSATQQPETQWPSDHAAAVTLFRLPGMGQPALQGSSTEGASTEGASAEGGSAEGGSTEGGSAEGGSTERASTQASNNGAAAGSRVSSSSLGIAGRERRFRAGAVSVTGPAKTGHTLTAHTVGWSPAPRFEYQWFAGARKIRGAKHRSLKLTAADHGRAVTVMVTAAHGGYLTKTVVSRAKKVAK